MSAAGACRSAEAGREDGDGGVADGTAPAASIIAYPNGPLLVRGDFEIITPEGAAVPRDRQTVALCRCGGSAIKPFCDGRHKLLNFDTESSAKEPTPRTRGQEQDGR